MSIINLSCHNNNNAGDMAAAPADYFDFPFELEKLHIQGYTENNKDIIFGGGGIIHNPNSMSEIVLRNTGKMITWGCGHNIEGGKDITWPNWMDKIELHGMRDYNTAFNWVPCVSCMSPLFDKKQYPIFDVVVYESRNFLLGINGFPKMNNQANTLENILTFLSSGNIILTNSYHGAYWGTLLGRKVIIVNPFSTKFTMFKHQPIISDRNNWKNIINKSIVFHEALDNCRAANKKHFERVCNLLLHK